MSVLEEAERVLSALGRVGSHLKQSDDPAVTRELGAHLGRLVALLENPAFSRLLKIQDSLQQLKSQLAAHPSLVPTDFDIVPETGDLELALTPPVPAERLSSPDQAPPAPAARERPSPGQQGSVEKVAASPAHKATNQDRLAGSNHVIAAPHQPAAVDRLIKPAQQDDQQGASRQAEPEPELESPVKPAREPEPVWESEREPEPELEPEPVGVTGQDPGLGLEYEPEQKSEMRPVVEAVSSVVANATPNKTQRLDPPEDDTSPIMTGTYERELERVIAEAAKGRQVIPIQLFKQEGSSLGLSVAGLTSEQNHELGIFVQGLQPDGIAARDGRLREGDQILAIDGQPLDANISHPQAISILQRARGAVTLVVARAPELSASDSSLAEPPPAPADPAQQQDMVLNTEWAQVEVIDLVNDGTGLGFGIIGGRSTGVVVKTILPGGVADRDGRLQSGDHILQIGQYNLRGMESIQVAQVLRTAGTQVRLIVARPVEPSNPDIQVDSSVITRAPIVPTRLLADPDELDHQLQALQNGFPEPYIRDSTVDENNLINGQLATEYELREAPLVDPAAALDELQSQYVAGLSSGLPSGLSDGLPGGLSAGLSGGLSSGLSDGLTGLSGTLPGGLSTGLAGDLSAASLPSAAPGTGPGPGPGPGPGSGPGPGPTSISSDTEMTEVELVKDTAGLGVTIAGYVCEREELSGIFIKSVNPGSAADLSGKIAINDQIVEVDGTPLQGYTNHQAVELLKSTGQVVRLKLTRYISGPKYDQLQLAIARDAAPPPAASAVVNTSTETSSRTSSQPQELVSGSSVSTQPVGSSSAPLSMELETSAEQVVAAASSAAPFPGSNTSYSEAIDKQVLLEDLEKLIDSDYHGEIKPEVETAIQLKWGKILGDEYDIVVAQISKFQPGGGLGVSLEGTVDVEDGREVRPHHYIRSILADGPVGVNGRLQGGDELLEVNGRRLLGLNHMEVVNTLKELPVDVRMVCARRSGHPPLHAFDPPAQARTQFAARSLLSGSLGQLFPSERLVKAKSDGSLASSGATTSVTDTTSMSRLRSRSMEPLSGLAMWASEPQVFILEKAERGLGFSILDYQDPMNPSDTVIVIRSLVPGGAAQLDGRLIPGDRLMSVNDVHLENASLDEAVQALKGAPMGAVRIGVAKPLPLAADTSSSQELTASSHSETEIDLEGADVDRRSSSSASSSTDISRLQNLEPEEAPLAPLQLPPPPVAPPPPPALQSDDSLDLSSADLSDIRQVEAPVPAGRQERLLSAGAAPPPPPPPPPPAPRESRGGPVPVEPPPPQDPPLPASPAVLRYGGEIPPLPDELQRTVRIRKGGEELGLNVEVVDKGVNGVPVKSVTRGSAVHRDGSIKAGDYIVSVNNETMRNVTQAQAKAVLRRCQLISTDITIVFVPSEDAAIHREAALIQIKRHADKIKQINMQNFPKQISPRVFPKYYRSPYFAPDGSSSTAAAATDVSSDSDPAALTRSNTAPNLSSRLARVAVEVPLEAVSAFSLPQTADEAAQDRLHEAPPPPPPPAGRRADSAEPWQAAGAGRTRSDADLRRCRSEELAAAGTQTPDDEGHAERGDTTILTVEVDGNTYSRALPPPPLPGPTPAHDVTRDSVASITSGATGASETFSDAARTSSQLSSQLTTDSWGDEPAGGGGGGSSAVDSADSSSETRRTVEAPAAAVSRTAGGAAAGGSAASSVDSPLSGRGSGSGVAESPVSGRALAGSPISGRGSVSGGTAGSPGSPLSQQASSPASGAGSPLSEHSSAASGASEGRATPRRPSPPVVTGVTVKNMVSQGTPPSPGAAPAVAPPSQSPLGKHWGPERSVMIRRSASQSLGISIVGGKVDLYSATPGAKTVISGIFIKNVLADSVAGRTAQLKTGDRILSVDGTDLRSASHDQAVAAIRSSGETVEFVVQSLVHRSSEGSAAASREGASGAAASTASASPPASTASTAEPEQPEPTEPREQQPEQPEPAKEPEPEPEVIQPGYTARPRPAGRLASQASAESLEEDEDSRTAGRFITPAGVEIDRASAGFVKLSRQERVQDTEEEDEFMYTTKKIQKKYGDLPGEVLLIELQKGSNGLGLSLAGNKDRTRMSVFVCGLNPQGNAFKDGRIRTGDEILEVNGQVLHGRCHLNASAIIKGLPGPVIKIILLRREEALEDLAVRPITQFPVSLQDETPEQKYAKYKGLRNVQVKKGTQGLGIMIFEGKHAEVGQGIFISDLQTGSPAEQAGLSVGDMILSVNNEDLVGADYDTAAGILKRAEGVLVLWVSNPSRAARDASPSPSHQSAGQPAPAAGQPGQPGQPPSPAAPAPAEPEKPRIPPKPVLNSTQWTNSTAPAPAAVPTPVPVPTPAPPVPTPSTAATAGPPPVAPRPPPKPSKPTLPAAAAPAAAAPAAPGAVQAVPAAAADGSSPTEEPPADPATCLIVPGRQTTIEISKEKMGLGLSIVGGSDTLLGAIIIHEVYPDGAAAKDGRLKPGDQVLEVNNENFRDASHNKALAVLRQTPAKVRMLVYREEGATKEEDVFETMDVQMVKKPGKGLGLSIVGRKNGPGVFISDVVKGGVAEADGRLIQGDQILSVNGQDLKVATQEQAASILKTSMGKISMVVGRLKVRNAPAAAPAATTGNANSKVPDAAPTTAAPPPPPPPPPPATQRVVVLERGADGLGFSVVGGHGSPQGDLPIYVKTVFERGAAADESSLRRGDMLRSVNGASLAGVTHQQAVAILTAATGTVTLVVES